MRRAHPTSSCSTSVWPRGTTAPRPAALDATMGPSLVATRPLTTARAGFSGTVQYMAPEQLEGDPGDHRADIFAFGCVLYEMLAGRKAFEGASAVTVIAAITNTEPPPIVALQSAHPLIDHILRRCLEKDRERRWQSIDDVTGELRWILDHPVVAAGGAPSQPRASLVRRVSIALALVFASAALTAALFAVRGGRAAPDRSTIRFEFPTAPTDDASIAVSPDGTQIAFVANQDRVPALWLRSLDAIDNRVLPGTEHATYPFWSPDSRTVGFFAGGKVKRIDPAGGTPLAIADAPNPRGASWNADGVILFSFVGGQGLMRVSARGGSVEQVTTINTGSGPDHRWPQFLPDGKRFLFTSNLGTPETNGVYLASLDKAPPVRLVSDDGAGRFAAPDRLLTLKQGALQAYRFDTSAGVVQGEPVLLAQGFTGSAGNPGFATSSTGVLAYRVGSAQRRQLVWVNRQGAVVRAIGEPETDHLASPELSPDERSVVVVRQRTGDNDIWVVELARNLGRRVTDGPPADTHPLWNPDGQHVVFFSRRFGGGGPARQAVAGGKAEPLFVKGESGQVLSWSRDGRLVLIRRNTQEKGTELVAVSVPGDKSEVPIASSPFDETEGQLSPDGKWVAFVSNDSGRAEAFVQSFPEGRARTQVSTAGGAQVRWSFDGKEIFYVAPDGKMMAVSMGVDGTSPDVKLPVALFQTHLATGFNVLGTKPQYAVSRDGRFLLNTAIESASAPIVVSVNWMKKLEK